jgi:hypothetical protein
MFKPKSGGKFILVFSTLELIFDMLHLLAAEYPFFYPNASSLEL